MQRITREQAMKYEFDHRHEPLLRVEQGESFVVETEDAGSGMVRSPDVAPRLMDMPTRKFEPAKGNPIGGPIYVEGAEKGDLLEVTIEKVIVDDQGFTNMRPRRWPAGRLLQVAVASRPVRPHHQTSARAEWHHPRRQGGLQRQDHLGPAALHRYDRESLPSVRSRPAL